jgi:ESS family glutamate:Na+ symporter
MLGGVLITNLSDAFRVQLAFAPIERNGTIALQAFLAMYLMSLKLWAIGAAIAPLAVNVVLQIAITAAVAYLVLFRLLGRDYDAALTAGGFIGFGLSSVAVGMATMDKLVQRLGPAPKAFLLITLAGSFFVDLANAFIVQLFLALPLFR